MSDDDVLPDDLIPVDDAPVDEAALGDGWRALHPLSPLVNLLPQAWGVVRQFWPILLAFAIGGTVNGASIADLTIIAMFGGIAVLRTLLHWATLRWRVSDGRLEIVTGLIRRDRRVIPRSKVQDVELVRNVFQRAAGLVEVRVQTASGGDVEGQLSALSVDDAEALVRALAPRRPRVAPTDDVVARNGLGDLLRYGGTSARLGAIAVALGLLIDWTAGTDPARLGRLGASLCSARAAVLVPVALLAAWALALGDAVVRHHGFTLRRVHDRLVAEEGLLTRRRVELDLGRVQLVTLREPLLRRLLGFGSLSVETAAARTRGGGTERAATTVPVVHADDVDRIVREAVPGLDVALATPLHPPDRRALRRALVRGALEGVALVGVVALVSRKGAIAAAALSWLPALVAWLDWRAQGWLVTDRVVVARRGFLARSTVIVDRGRLQAVDVDQGPLLRRWGLGEIVLKVAGSAVAMPLLDHGEAFRLGAGLSATAARRADAPP